MPTTDPALSVARRTVATASRVARAVQRDLDRVRAVTKDDRSPVTVADFAVQAIVALDLCADDPDALIVGEEHAALLREPERRVLRDAVVEAVRRVRPEAGTDEVLDAIDRCDHDAVAGAYWTLDPIDGTKGFLRGQQYAIALARIEDGEVTLGVMGCPNLPADRDRPLDVADDRGMLYAAVRGGGAWAFDPANDAEPRRLTAPERVDGAPVRICESVESAHTSQSDSARIVAALGSSAEPVRLDSQCKYAVVARGQADAYLRLPTRPGYVERIWDHAAGSLIAREAGGIVTDITGRALDFSRGAGLEGNRGVVCTAAALHPRIIAAIEKLGIGGG